MAYPNKINVTVASSKRSKHDLSSQHITTSNFMEIGVAKYMELVPGQTVDISHTIFSRLEPMPVPTFGRAYIRSKAFFVPYRTVMPAWNDFITDSPHTTGYMGQNMNQIISSVHRLPNVAIYDFFLQDTMSDVCYEQQKLDFRILLSDGQYASYVFTPKGRRAYKILTQLGYRPVFSHPTYFNDIYSALPLLSLVKVFIDWLYPGAYTQLEGYTALQALCQYDSNVPLTLTTAHLNLIFDMLDNIPYDNDFFTSAFDKPNGTPFGTSSNFNIPDINQASAQNEFSRKVQYNGSSVFENNGSENAPVLTGDPYNTNNGTPLNAISQFALDALKALTDYIKRHQLVGSRALDRYMARFGIQLPSEKMNRCQYLQSYAQDVEFGDVTSTADTDGANLGSYAGKGASAGNGNFKFQSNEYGMLLILTYIVPKISYYQGYDRTVKHLTKLDFFTPEFDNLSTQAISIGEVVTSPNTQKYFTGRTPEEFSFNNEVFGFAPRYAEYKISRDNITGDYAIGSRNVGKDAWTLARDLTYLLDKDGGIENVRHSLSFILPEDREQFNRIFYTSGELSDKFNIIHIFDITSSFPGKSLYDTYDFENEDESRKVSTQLNGNYAN